MGGLSNHDGVNNAYITNTDSYLTTPDYWYLTLTPFAATGGIANFNYVISNFLGFSNLVDTIYGGARPVVSLLSDAITGGSGTMNDPFTVG